MKLRLADPSLLVDLARRSCAASRGNGTAHRSDDPHVTLQSDDLGIVTAAAKLIADQQVRNRGTIGGSLAHGDPAADLPTVVLALDGSVAVKGPNGERTIAAADLFEDYLTTSIQPGELITELQVPSFDGYGHWYQKFTRRAEDWAMVGVAALVKADDTVEDVRVAFTQWDRRRCGLPRWRTPCAGSRRRRGDRGSRRARGRRHRSAQRPERHARLQAPPGAGAHQASAEAAAGRALDRERDAS